MLKVRDLECTSVEFKVRFAAAQQLVLEISRNRTNLTLQPARQR